MVADPASDAADEPAGAPSEGWDRGARKRFLVLTGGRAAAQVLGLVWFLVAARMLGETDFGEVVTGLAFFAVFAGVGDLGTTRTVVRHVAADHRTLASAYRKAMRLRVAGGLLVGTATAAVVALLPVPVSGWVVLLAGLMATASGATELAYAALRAVGRVRAEFWMLLIERLAFLAIGVTILEAGGGPIAVLGLYLFTNTVSAIIGTVAVGRAQTGAAVDAGSMVDKEARFTAAGFALVTVSPRIPSILLALMASAAAVGAFGVSQRPVEAMTLFALSTAAPVLPIVRSRLIRGLHEDAERAAISVVGALMLVLAPAVGWFLATPQAVVDLLFGDGRFPGSATVLRILAFTSITWAMRGIGEFVLLAEERAPVLFRLTAIGTVVTVLVGVPLILHSDEKGAALAVLAAEVVMTVLLARAVPLLVQRKAVPAYAVAAAFLAASGLTASLLSSTPALVPAVAVVAWTGVAALVAVRQIRGLERMP